MNRKNILTTIFVLAATFAVTACGFHLRGSAGDANLPFSSIFIALPKNSALGIELKRYIRSVDGTKIETDRKKAQVVLESIAESKKKVILTLNSQGRVREYTLSYLIRFRVVDQKGNILMEPTDIEQKRTLAYNEAQALAKEAEEAMLYKDMQSDLAQQIMRRLIALKMPD